MENNNKEELVALIKYLINHNEHHNQELEELATSLKDVDNDAYLKVKDAIEYFKKGNSVLGSALNSLNKQVSIMCLSIIYKDKVDEKNILMKNVMSIEEKNNTLIFTDLMERKMEVTGKLTVANLVDGYVIVHTEGK